MWQSESQVFLYHYMYIQWNLPVVLENVTMIFHKISNWSDLPLHLLQCIHLFSGIQMIPTHLTRLISQEDLKINTRRLRVTSLTEAAVPRKNNLGQYYYQISTLVQRNYFNGNLIIANHGFGSASFLHNETINENSCGLPTMR